MPRNSSPEGVRQRGIRRGSTGNFMGRGEDDLSSASETRKILSVPVDDYDNSTDCEEFCEEDGPQKNFHHSFSGSDEEKEELTDIEDSSDEDIENCPSSKPAVTRRSAKELSLYIQRVLGRPLRAVTCFKECEHGGTVIQTEYPDEDETSEDESSFANDSNFDLENEQESIPASQISDVEASDDENDLGIDLNHDESRGNDGKDGDISIIDSYLQGHFARLSSTDNDTRGRSDSEVDEAHLAPGIIVSNWNVPGGSDASHPVTEEEILSEREAHRKPITIRAKRSGRTRGQFSKQSNYLTASLPTLGQSETDSESESDGRQLIRSSFYQAPGSHEDLNEENASKTFGFVSNLPSTDSESLELEEEDSLQIDSKNSPKNTLTSNESNPVKIVSQLSITDN